ncbi:PAS domain-containing sensor histidine kinase [Hoyosella sp. YIM 151337]|uniref:PAS domain-containing sensor histidine kinase n=1 Tax=Hoyosella sp. YIM 151337 TaxID=2992742 RepID=UPI002235D6B8|nr:PAS domain-containing sensor histidine kinase [Hoyosella sp. YIM 151337]MCW4355931.1 PAS domain-containing sensor histidine kinase [Hoyosella sp. YIM 151337]
MSDFERDFSSNAAHLFHGIVDQNAAGIYLAQGGVLRYVNRQFARFFGTTPERLEGRSVADVAPPKQRARLVAHYENRIEGAPLPHFLIQAEIRDQGLRQIELHGNRVVYRGEPAVVGIALDVTEREDSHAELVESRSQLRALMSRLENAQDAERTQIALELHDNLGGLLTALKFDTARMRRRLERLRSDPVTPAAIDELLQLNSDITGTAQESIAAVRRLSEQLRPSSLAELGFYGALRDYAAKFETRYGIAVSIAFPHDASCAAPAAELDAFRMLQEGLTNVARHAEATQVTVVLSREKDALVFSIADNGRGYPPENHRRSGLGLVGVRERARRLGGRVDFGNGPAGGARIVVHLPWQFST